MDPADVPIEPTAPQTPVARVLKPYAIVIPGIEDQFCEPSDWDYQAQAYFHDRGVVAVGFNYYASVFDGLAVRVPYKKMIAGDIRRANATGLFLPLWMVGHSNACGIISEFFLDPENDGTRVGHLHLIAAAMNADCRHNGLNEASERNQFDAITVYVSPTDIALAIGGIIGYGDLGRVGPRNMSPTLAEKMQIFRRNCNHMDWVSTYFEDTMQEILKDAQ